MTLPSSSTSITTNWQQSDLMSFVIFQPLQQEESVSQDPQPYQNVETSNNSLNDTNFTELITISTESKVVSSF